MVAIGEPAELEAIANAELEAVAAELEHLFAELEHDRRPASQQRVR